MIDGAIEDKYIYGWSSLADSLPEYARLNHNSSWIPTVYNSGIWIKVYFTYQVLITGIITQGDERRDSWVKSFRVDYCLDHVTWTHVVDDDGAWEVRLKTSMGPSTHAADAGQLTFVETAAQDAKPTKMANDSLPLSMPRDIFVLLWRISDETLGV